MTPSSLESPSFKGFGASRPDKLGPLGTDEGGDAIGIEQGVEPGVQLRGRGRGNALFSPVRQGSEATGEQPLDAFGLALGSSSKFG
jgi:hypothetical protein